MVRAMEEKDRGESRENVYQFFILEISMKCHKYEIINEILIRLSVLINEYIF